MRQQRIFIAAIVSAIAVSVAAHGPANATNVSSSGSSCSSAKSVLDQAHSMMPAAPSETSDLDKDFAATEYRVAQAQVVIGHVVAKCSKSAANREAALEMARDAERRMALFRNQGTSL